MREHKKFIRYSPEQLADLRNTDMVDFLERRGFKFKKVGREYHDVEHDSLVINQDRKRWYWNSKGVGGNNVIDWFSSIDGIDFQECCRIMLGGGQLNYTPPKYAKSVAVPPPEKKPFVPPKRQEGVKYSRVYAYLTKSRCIDSAVVKALFDKKYIYQEDGFGNCVFAGYDENGIMRFAERRSCATIKRYNDKGKEIKFRPTVESADYSYGFHLDADKNAIEDRVFVFEAPIDLLSHCTLVNIKMRDSEAYRSHNRVSLAGVSDIALSAYLSRHQEIKTIVLCLDNDEGGLKARRKYIEKYEKLGYEVIDAPVQFGKDYNDLLQEVVRRIEEKKQNNNPKATCDKDVSSSFYVRRKL